MVNVKDYYEYIKEQFPEVTLKDIKRILNYGFKQLYLLNSFGGDLIIKDSDFWSYIGTLQNNSIKHFHYYKNKLTIRLRVLYKRKNIQWDGYYYFALSENQYQNYLLQKNSKGRRKKKFNFGTVKLYKIFNECEIQEFNKQYIFKMPIPIDFGYTLWKQKLITDKAELIIKRDPMKFEDILVTNHKYDFL